MTGNAVLLGVGVMSGDGASAVRSSAATGSPTTRTRRRRARPPRDPSRVPNEFELIGGIEKRDIVVVPYSPEWSARFDVERQRIEDALGAIARRVDHVGSTSVPGLPAKPIVDIDLSVPDADDELAYLPALEGAGYRLRVRQRGHRMVRTPALDVHVHICTDGCDWERRHLLFRDWLRNDGRDRDAYAALKQDLAMRAWPDMNAYAEAKSSMISDITRRAEAWAERVGWSVGE
jgi:GrpB-like predicted nucleotidyltransferase (UPF0157 family)